MYNIDYKNIMKIITDFRSNKFIKNKWNKKKWNNIIQKINSQLYENDENNIKKSDFIEESEMML